MSQQTYRHTDSLYVCMSVRKKVWNDSNFFCKKVCKIASVRRKIRFNQWESSIYFQILFISTTTHCLLMFVSRFINFININIIHYYYYLYFSCFEILFHQRFISVRNPKVNTWILFVAFSLFMSNFKIFLTEIQNKRHREVHFESKKSSCIVWYYIERFKKKQRNSSTSPCKSRPLQHRFSVWCL